MGIPVVVPECRVNYSPSLYPQSVLLGAQSTPVWGILEWQWTLTSWPTGSTVATGANGNFNDGVASLQMPTFNADLPGTYTADVKARNLEGWSFDVAVKIVVATSLEASIAAAQATANTANSTAILALTRSSPPVADLVELAALDVTGLPMGTMRYVVSTADEYVLTAGAYVADGLEVISAAAPSTAFWIATLVGRWDDVQGDVSQGTANAALTYEVFRDTAFLMYFFRHDQNDSLSMRFQFPHGVLTSGTTVVPHLHIVPMVAPAVPPQNVRLTGAYAWALDGAAIPAAAGWTAFGPILQPIVAADAWVEKLVILSTIAVPVGFKGSSILLVNVVRTGTDVGDTYTTGKSTPPGTAAANVGLLSLDVHYRKAIQGSITVIP